jgi:hypothetical protein
MKIPPSISIGGQEVEIVIEKDLAEYGLFCLDDMRITLRSPIQTLWSPHYAMR